MLTILTGLYGQNKSLMTIFKLKSVLVTGAISFTLLDLNKHIGVVKFLKIFN